MAADIVLKLSRGTGVAGNQNANVSFGGAMSTNTANKTSATVGAVIVEGTNVLNNLWDDVTKDENLAGTTEYRLIYVHNRGTTSFAAGKIYLTGNPNATFEVALDPAAIGSDSTITLADEIDSTNQLSGVTFAAFPTTSGTALSLGGTLAAGSKKGVWIKRTAAQIEGGGTVSENVVLNIIGSE